MSLAVRQALYAKMSSSDLPTVLADPAPGYTRAIYYQVAPGTAPFARPDSEPASTAVYPYVIFSKQSGIPTDALGFGILNGETLEDTDVWLIKGVVRASSADKAEDVAGRLVTLLNNGVLSGLNYASGADPGSGSGLVYLRRQSDVDYGEIVDGVQYHHAGSLYRLVYQ